MSQSRWMLTGPDRTGGRRIFSRRFMVWVQGIILNSGTDAPAHEEQTQILPIDDAIPIEVRRARIRTDAPGHKQQTQILSIDDAVSIDVPAAVNGVAVELKEVLEPVLARKRFFVVVRWIFRVDLVTGKTGPERTT